MSNMTKTIAILGVVAGLGVAALPLSTYAAPTAIEGTGTPLSAPKDVPVQLTIKETLNMYVTDEAGTADFTSPVKIGSSEIAAAGKYESDPIAVKVETANKGGYALTIVGSYVKDGLSGDDATNALTSLVNENNTMISAGALADADTESTWGYAVDTAAGETASFGTWTGVTDSAVEINKLTEAGTQTTKVKFGANIVAGQQAGTYNGQVTFTATAAPAA